MGNCDRKNNFKILILTHPVGFCQTRQDGQHKKPEKAKKKSAP